jgi:drug/metabolite transporter (DMT)-like permease
MLHCGSCNAQKNHQLGKYPVKLKLDWTAVGILVLCCTFWGLQQVLVKATIPFMPPLMQTGLRFIGATLILLAWCAYRGVDWRIPANGEGRKAAYLAGVLFAMEFLLMYLSLAMGNASRTTLFLYTSPFWVALVLGLVLRSEKLAPWQWAGLFIAFVGLFYALQESMQASKGSLGGISGSLVSEIMALMAGLSWGLTTVIIRSSAMRTWPAERVLFWQIFVSALSLPILSLLMGESWGLAKWTAFSVGSLLIQTIVGAFLTFLIWMWLLTRYPATLLSAFTFLTPLSAMIFGHYWLGEPLSSRLFIALIFVALGLVLVNRIKIVA